MELFNKIVYALIRAASCMMLVFESSCMERLLPLPSRISEQEIARIVELCENAPLDYFRYSHDGKWCLSLFYFDKVYLLDRDTQQKLYNPLENKFTNDEEKNLFKMQPNNLGGKAAWKSAEFSPDSKKLQVVFETNEFPKKCVLYVLESATKKVLLITHSFDKGYRESYNDQGSVALVSSVQRKPFSDVRNKVLVSKEDSRVIHMLHLGFLGDFFYLLCINPFGHTIDKR